MNEIKNKERDFLTAPLSYLIFIPSIYYILTEKNDSGFKAINIAQALLLWIFYAFIFIVIKTLLFFFGNIDAFTALSIGIFWGIVIFTIYTFFFSLLGKTPYIPIISNLALNMQNDPKQVVKDDKK